MIETDVIVKNTDASNSIDIKFVGELAKTALIYRSNSTIYKNNETFNAKSVLSLMSCNLEYGDKIHLRCKGDDEKYALDSIVELLTKGETQK